MACYSGYDRKWRSGLMSKRRSKLNQSKPIWFVLAGLIFLVLLVAVLLRGNDVVLFNPKGAVADDQHRLMVISVLIMLGVAIPTLFLLYFFAWKYRENGKKATTNHHSSNSKFATAVFWAIPAATVAILASFMLPATQKLEPQRTIEAGGEPVTVQVVALRWKWLFIYPKQNVATINFIQIPVGTPVQFELTADEAPMNSFWIPHLGGQLYAMTGHQNRLNLIAESTGDYEGSAAEINGAGFAGMRFITRVSSRSDFDLWINKTKQSTKGLTAAEYNKLLKPSQNDAATLYGSTNPDIYSKIVSKYEGSHGHDSEQAGY